MKKPLIALLAVTVALGGCSRISNSALNPLNWFGGGAEETATVAADGSVPADPRALVAQVTNVTFDRYPGGVIVRATGLPPTQGWWKADLVPRRLDENGVQVFDFRISPPDTATSEGPARSREITAAVALSDVKLQPIRRIVVQGASNALGADR